MDVSMMRLGLIHRPRPVAVPALGARLVMPSAPPSCDWHRYMPADGDALGNDVVGDCVEAAALNALYMRRAVHGDQRRPTEAQAAALYGAGAGYRPGDPTTDRGTDSVSAMTAWATSGIRADAQTLDLVAGASIRLAELRAAVALLGPVQVSIDLPIAAQDVSVPWH